MKSSRSLPVQFDPWRLTERGGRLQGRLSLRALPGLDGRLAPPAVDAGAGPDSADSADSADNAGGDDRADDGADDGVARDQIEIDLRGAIDDDGQRYIGGRLRASVPLLCQRCLEPFRLALVLQPRLAVVVDDAAAKKLPAQYEPLLTDGPQRLDELIAGEVLLALPLIPKHPQPEDCGPLAARIREPGRGGEVDRDDDGTVKPFAGLSDLLKD